MTKKELIQELDKLKSETFGGDAEAAHMTAEELLLKYFKENGMEDVCDKYDEVVDSYVCGLLLK